MQSYGSSRTSRTSRRALAPAAPRRFVILPIACALIVFITSTIVHAQDHGTSAPAAPRTYPELAAEDLTPEHLAEGERLFARRCAVCHGPGGEGGRGPTLAVPTLLRAPDSSALMTVIRGGISGTGMPGSRLGDQGLRQVAAWVWTLGRKPAPVLPGDTTRGARLFTEKGGCAACHTIGGRGGALGPDLTDIGRRRGVAHLRASLVTPEADVPKGFSMYRAEGSLTENFLQVRVTTRDRRQVLGVRVNEDSFSIQLRDGTGQFHSFFKSELIDLQKDWGRSPMPAYSAIFSNDELDDLVAYLASLRGE